MLRRRFFLAAIAFVACVLVFTGGRAASQSVLPPLASPGEPLPTVVLNVAGEFVKVPDWARISLGSFAVPEPGVIPHDYDGDVGYEFGRIWEAGASLAEVLKFGDLEESWQLGDLTLDDLARLTGLDLGDIPLADIAFLQDLTFDDLAAAISGRRFGRIGFGRGFGGLSGEIGSLSSRITLDDVPELGEIDLSEFPDIQDFAIGDIPGLDALPFDQIPGFINTIPGIVRLDMLYGSSESYANRASAGPDCRGECPHVEVFSPGNIIFGRWVSGRSQEVDGGSGVLKFVGGGKEPVGRHPFGSSFKFVFWDIDETIDRVETRIFFRVCKTFLGCTPYNLPPGGVPFIPFSRDDYVPA